MIYFKRTLIIICFLPGILLAQREAQIEAEIDESTGLKTWKLIQSGLELQLVQRSPDQTRGFYLGRGFTKKDSNEIATQCVFQTIVKNTALQKTGEAISIALKTWRLKKINAENDQTQRIKLKEDWASQWSQDNNKQVTPSARIAFKWSTFPSEQTFEAGGDYNWGMITFGLPPGEQFDLHVFWHTNQQTHEQWISNIQCPIDQ